LDAVSKEEKLETCLHSEVCGKFKHSKNFKCTACTEKRSMIAFQCPHCSASLCQLCVSTFSKRRKRVQMKEQMVQSSIRRESGGMGDGPSSDEPDTNKLNKTKDNDNGPMSASLRLVVSVPSNQRRDPRSRRPKPTHLPSRLSSQARAETITKSTMQACRKHVKTRQQLLLEYRLPVITVRCSDRDDKPTDATGSKPTRGYVGTLPTTPMPPMAILRRAMESFGVVVSLRVTNERLGIAHVEFAKHDGLCRAIAASPMLVNEAVKVRVAELKHYRAYGKDGHDAQHCKATWRNAQEPS
jgi:hypothetical protein